MTWGTPISGSLQIYQLVGLKNENLANELAVGRRLENCLKCYFRGSQGWPKPKLTALELGKDHCEIVAGIPLAASEGFGFWIPVLKFFDSFWYFSSDQVWHLGRCNWKKTNTEVTICHNHLQISDSGSSSSPGRVQQAFLLLALVIRQKSPANLSNPKFLLAFVKSCQILI